MPIDFPFFLLAGPARTALRWIRIDIGPPLAAPEPDPRLVEAQRRAVEHLPPHLRSDVLRDE